MRDFLNGTGWNPNVNNGNKIYRQEKKDDAAIIQPQISGTPDAKKINPKFGDELLEKTTAEFLGASFTHRPQAGSIEDLSAKRNINVQNVDRADRLAAAKSVDNPLVSAYMFGPLNGEGERSTLTVLQNFDPENMPEFMLDDILADVEINVA